jgi:hypothetical protein
MGVILSLIGLGLLVFVGVTFLHAAGMSVSGVVEGAWHSLGGSLPSGTP